MATKIGLQIGHEQRGGDAFAGNVADDQAKTIRAEIEKIVVIAADGASRVTMAGIVQPANRGTPLREKTALDFVGDFEFLSGATFGFEFCGGSAALGFERMGHFVKADEKEDVSVNVAETGHDTAPNGRFETEHLRIV